MSQRWIALFAAASLGLPGLAAARTVPAAGWCGVHPSRLEIARAAREDRLRRQTRESAELVSTGPRAAAAGNVALLVDDGSLVHQPNPFDLADSAMTFARVKTGLKVVAGGPPVSTSSLGTRLPLTDDSSAAVKFPAGFRFRFFNKLYTGVYVNSDGNLTFGAPDFDSSERGLPRFLNGPPRIAPFFSDLNPEKAPANGGIFVLASRAKVVVTWVAVPGFGENDENTFQVTLLADGHVFFAYGRLDTPGAVVGVAPGGGGGISLVDYTTDLPLGGFTGAVAERFGADRELDDLAIANAFFRQFADVYDHLIVWLDFPLDLGGGAFAYEFGVKNDVKGIGQPVFDQSALAGSHGRLRSFVQMGSLDRYPADVDETFLGTNTTMDVLGQEAGHRWLAYLHFRDATHSSSTDLLGRSLAHWSFRLDSDASDMEGNDIQDDGGGFFETIGATERYSPLDQYAMGLRSADEVPSFFYVADTGGFLFVPSHPPEIGVTLVGRRVDVGIQAVIAAEGPRVPASGAAPKGFRMAFVLVSEGPPQASSIAHVDAIRARWEAYFQSATDLRGTVDTTLQTR